MSKNVTICEFV